MNKNDKFNDNANRIFTIIFFGLISFSLMIGTHAFDLPPNSGGWFYEYSAGILTLVGGGFAIYAAKMAIENTKREINQKKEAILQHLQDISVNIYHHFENSVRTIKITTFEDQNRDKNSLNIRTHVGYMLNQIHDHGDLSSDFYNWELLTFLDAVSINKIIKLRSAYSDLREAVSLYSIILENEILTYNEYKFINDSDPLASELTPVKNAYELYMCLKSRMENIVNIYIEVLGKPNSTMLSKGHLSGIYQVIKAD